MSHMVMLIGCLVGEDIGAKDLKESKALSSVAAAYKSHGVRFSNIGKRRKSSDASKGKAPVVINDVMRKFGAAISKKVIQFGTLQSPVGTPGNSKLSDHSMKLSSYVRC